MGTGFVISSIFYTGVLFLGSALLWHAPTMAAEPNYCAETPRLLKALYDRHAGDSKVQEPTQASSIQMMVAGFLSTAHSRALEHCQRRQRPASNVQVVQKLGFVMVTVNNVTLEFAVPKTETVVATIR